MSTSHPSLLCFDGGGVRGLSSLYLVKQLMESINQDAPPKPCEVFDMIGGTSTGGLIAIMLGRLEMSVDECIKQYIALSKTVFKREHYLPFRKRDGSIQARFSTSALEAAIKKIVAESDVAKVEGSGENALMRTKSSTKCRTFVVALSKHFADDHAVFSSYSRPREADRELFDNTKIWEAARATSAASTFFDSINIGDPPVSFVDGGVGRNNPLPVLWDEAGTVWGGRDGDQLDARVRYVVSIGTGMSLPGPFGNNLVAVFETLKATATETEQTANAFIRNHKRLIRENRYFRFNVTQGLENVGLEEYDKLSTIRSATTRYGEDPMVQLALIRFEDTVMAARHDGAINSSVNVLDTVSQPGVSLEVNAASHNPTERTNPRQPRNSSSEYYALDSSGTYFANRIRHTIPDCYWTHLTPDGMRVYDLMYETCIENSESSDGTLDFNTFAGQFTNRNPRPELIRECWSRLETLNTRLDRNHVLAVTYMIHVESMLDNERLELIQGKPYLSDRRRKIINHFGEWVDCHCQCGRKWNYANSKFGMQRDVNSKRKCEVDRWMRATLLKRLMYARGEELEADNRHLWFGRNSR